MTPGLEQCSEWKACRAKVEADLNRHQSWLGKLDERLRSVEQSIGKIIGISAGIGAVIGSMILAIAHLVK